MSLTNREGNGIARGLKLPPMLLMITGLLACMPQLSLRADQTVGEQFREVMARIDHQCRQEKKGPYLDPKDPEYGDKRRYTDCDILKLKPADPLSTPEGRFAHALKLPAPHDVAKDVWRAGMTGEEYFQALCEAEAGEWVFRTVEGVEGIRQARPIDRTNYHSMMGSYFAAEVMAYESVAKAGNPAGYLIAADVKRWPTYSYLEIPLENSGNQGKFVRFFRDTGVPTGAPSYGVSTAEIVHPEARYGFAWRGLSRANARENGILGAELLLIDVATQEVLAFRRMFFRLHFDPTYRDPREMWPKLCQNTKFDSGFAFITRVIRPIKGEGK